MRRSPLILSKITHLVEKMGDLCGKLTKIHPWQHKAVRLACDRGAAGIYEAQLRMLLHTAVSFIHCNYNENDMFVF